MNTNHRNRKPTRLRGFDYAQRRAYFVTVCTQERCEILAKISRGGALLLPIGEIVEQEIYGLQLRYDVVVEKYVIMPNHIHMILFLRGNQPAKTLSDVLCTLKSITTKRANQIDGYIGRQIWQRSFHDHIIRDEEDYSKIWQYIDENPVKWSIDCFYPNNDGEKAQV